MDFPSFWRCEHPLHSKIHDRFYLKPFPWNNLYSFSASTNSAAALPQRGLPRLWARGAGRGARGGRALRRRAEKRRDGIGRLSRARLNGSSVMARGQGVGSRSGEKTAQHLSVDIAQPEVSSPETVGEFLMVESQQV
jgi:hypothetical protein